MKAWNGTRKTKNGFQMQKIEQRNVKDKLNMMQKNVMNVIATPVYAGNAPQHIYISNAFYRP